MDTSISAQDGEDRDMTTNRQGRPPRHQACRRYLRKHYPSLGQYLGHAAKYLAKSPNNAQLDAALQEVMALAAAQH